MKHGRTLILLLAALVLTTVLLAGCSQQQATPTQEIKIGVVASMTGSASRRAGSRWEGRSSPSRSSWGTTSPAGKAA
jgi:hypothetical protein